MGKPNERPVPPGLTVAAQKERERFEQDYLSLVSDIAATPLTILVWGPDPSADTPESRKRIEIRDTLIADGHNAMFSEDMPNIGVDLSDYLRELAQATLADYIVVLMCSPGSIAEVHDFTLVSKLASKLLVLVDERYKGGYSGLGLLTILDQAGDSVYWYKTEEIENCNVLTRVMKRAKGLREIKARRIHGGAA